MRCALSFYKMFHIEQLLFRLKIIGIFLGQLGAKPPDAAVQVPFHQRFKGGKVAPLDGVHQVAVVCDAPRQGRRWSWCPASGSGCSRRGRSAGCSTGTFYPWRQTMSRAGHGRLRTACCNPGSPWPQGPRRLPPACGSTPAAPGCTGAKNPAIRGLPRRCARDQLVHDAAVQPGNGGALVRHDLYQPVFLQLLQHHPDRGARCAKAGTERIFAQRRAGADGQVNDLPLQHSMISASVLYCSIPLT